MLTDVWRIDDLRTAHQQHHLYKLFVVRQCAWSYGRDGTRRPADNAFWTYVRHSTLDVCKAFHNVRGKGARDLIARLDKQSCRKVITPRRLVPLAHRPTTSGPGRRIGWFTDDYHF